MKFRIERMRFITRHYVRSNRDKLFLFGDNLERRGHGGHAAAMRGEPSTVGIPTKKSPSYRDDAFFSDEEFEKNKAAINAAFAEVTKAVMDSIRAIVTPSDGLGTGRGSARQTGAAHFCLPAIAVSRTGSRKLTPLTCSHIVPAET